MKRPFWLHQLVDYIVGIMLMSQAAEASKPLVPLLLGFLVLVNAACVDGPMAAYRGLSRPHHRIADLFLLGLIVVVVITGFGIEGSGRGTFIGIAVLWAVVIVNSNFAPKVQRAKIAPGQHSTEAGKMAGRVVAGGINSWRRRGNSR